MALALFAAQALVGGSLAIAWQAGRGGRSGAAALLGTLIAVVPGLFFAWRLLGQRPGASTKHIARAMILGEAGKLALTAALFLLAAVWFGREFVPVLTTYMACLVCYWLALVGNR